MLAWIVLFVTVAASAMAQAPPQGGKFCVRNPDGSFDLLLIGPAPNGGLNFGLSSWSGGGNFAVSGVARPTGTHWRFAENLRARDPAERCAVTVTPQDGGFVVTTEEGARCQAYAGVQAIPRDALTFTAAARMGEITGIVTSERLMRESCEPARGRASPAGTDPATGNTCPATLGGRQLTGVTVFDGPPSQMASQVPVTIGRWSGWEVGDGRQYQAECHYRGAGPTHVFAIAPGARRCTSLSLRGMSGTNLRCE